MAPIVGPTGISVRRSRFRRLSSDVSVNLVRRSAHAAIRRRTRSASVDRRPPRPSAPAAGTRWTPTVPPIIGSTRATTVAAMISGPRSSSRIRSQESWSPSFTGLLRGHDDDARFGRRRLRHDRLGRRRLAGRQLDVARHMCDRGLRAVRRRTDVLAGRNPGATASRPTRAQERWRGHSRSPPRSGRARYEAAPDRDAGFLTTPGASSAGREGRRRQEEPRSAAGAGRGVGGHSHPVTRPPPDRTRPSQSSPPDSDPSPSDSPPLVFSTLFTVTVCWGGGAAT